MSYRFYLSIQLIFLITFNCYSQTYWIEKTPLLDSLYKWDKTISQINMTDGQQFLPITIKNKKTDQSIIKTKKGLYILINGTGQVYKASTETISQIAFSRIDSTFYCGYNFHAINVSYRDTLFSIGGEGFWHYNGQFRYFNGLEWNILSLNEEYPVDNYHFNFLPQKSKLYFFIHPYTDPGTLKKEDDFKVVEFDFTTKKNKLLGKITNATIQKSTPYNIDIPNLNGILEVIDNKVYFLKPSDNTFFKARNNKYLDEIINASNTELKNSFSINDTVYYTRSPNYDLHSFIISMDDFEKVPIPLYEPIVEIPVIMST